MCYVLVVVSELLTSLSLTLPVLRDRLRLLSSLPDRSLFFDLSLVFFELELIPTIVLPNARPLLPGQGRPVSWLPGKRTSKESTAALPLRYVSTPT